MKMIAHADGKVNILRLSEELKMQKSGGAVTLMKNIDVIYLAGGPLEEKKPLAPYSEQVCEFLGELSKRIQKDKEAKQYPDVLSFAFFCRSGNIKRLKTEFEDGRVRLGKGNVFHIAPSNIPINFAFTYVFGLLAMRTLYVFRRQNNISRWTLYAVF